MNNSKKFPRGVEITTSAIIENEKGEILLTQQPKWKNKWLFPGGHIEPGETINQSLIREVKEEVGLNINEKDIKIISFGQLIDSSDFHRSAHLVFFDCYCKIKNQNILLDEKEIKKYVWIKIKEAIKMNMEKTSAETLKRILKTKTKN